MCLRCDGFSEEEVERTHDLTIRVHGFLRLWIQDHDSIGDWTYTMGLLENFDHPELICVQVDPGAQQVLLQALGEAVVEDGLIDPAVLSDLDVRLVPVHEDHVAADLVGTWCNRYDRAPGSGEFLQVIPGASWTATGYQADVQSMDDPAPLLGAANI